MAIMSASGILGDLEPETIKIWKFLLIDLEYKYFEQAVGKICRETVNFYPGTNIPALIRETADNFKSLDFARREENNFQKRFQRYQEEACSPEELKKVLEECKLKNLSGAYFAPSVE